MSDGTEWAWVESGALPPEVEKQLRSARARLDSLIAEGTVLIPGIEASFATNEKLKATVAHLARRLTDLCGEGWRSPDGSDDWIVVPPVDEPDDMAP